jgi:hypothetical protein
MALELETRTGELREILKVVDESVRLLNHFSGEKEMGMVHSVSEKVEWSIERLLHRGWVDVDAHLHEVVYYLDLACFSLLKLNGESFQIYLQEVNQRYRVLLRSLSHACRRGVHM